MPSAALLAVLALLMIISAAAAVAARAPARASGDLLWPDDVKPAGGCGIDYSPRFSHGGGCSQTSLGGGSPSTYCKSFGKQRAIVRVPTAGRACARLPWRRYDDPAEHAAVVTSAAGAVVPSALTDANATIGEVCFTAAAAGDFAVYFLPFRWAFGGGSGSYCSFFLNASETVAGPAADPACTGVEERVDCHPSPGGETHCRAMGCCWEPSHSGSPHCFHAKNGSGAPVGPPTAAATAAFVGFESKTAFDKRSPMEMLASPAEVAAMLAAAKRRDYLTFVTPIAHTTTQSLRLDALPLPLARAGPN